MRTAKERYKKWLEKLPAGDPMREELEAIAGDEKEIRERFSRVISFGTAGLRGICSAGTSRMNILTIGRAVQGIANYIKASGADPDKGVVIAYDCRYHSREFSELAASILAANRIRVYLFPEMRPTPELSFTVRQMRCAAGLNLTASHNPKEYNGMKVYWSDGAQISGAVSDGISEEIGKLDFFRGIRQMPLAEAEERGLLVMLGEKTDRAYLSYVKSMRRHKEEDLDLTASIVYTPLNGTGAAAVRQVLTEMGFWNFRIVPEQEMPDPEFTTVGYPNPEDPKTFRLAEELGASVGADVLIATDPDSDRMAIEIPCRDGKYHFLNGNQTGAMLIAYMAEGLRERGEVTKGSDTADLPHRYALIKSIVTGDMGAAIARSYGIAVFETLTGFKNICGKIHDIEKEGFRYFFGYEESIGCAPSAEVRDKDGVCSTMLIAEMTAYYRKRGMTLEEVLEALYREYGYFYEEDVSLVREGEEGIAQIAGIMEAFRQEKLQTFGALQVREIIDYLEGHRDVPVSNAMRFDFGDGTWFALRPSGTEPKLKFYYYACAEDRDTAAARVHDMRAGAEALIERTEAQ